MKQFLKKILKRKSRNQGNSYIMVVATISFLAVLVAAILVAVALIYRLKAYDINSRDNFYYLEQAMDEIYAGVGADAMLHLNAAYEDTVEVLVYFDPDTQSYVTMDTETANKRLKSSFISRVKSDSNYDNADSIKSHLLTFLSYPHTDYNGVLVNDEGVQVYVDNVAKTDDEVTIVNLILKREAAYSTINTRKPVAGSEGQDTFVQSITTDLAITKPEFDVNFNSISAELNSLYPFAVVADSGIEVNGSGTKVNIVGDVYAASDFYNKDYNITDTGHDNYIPKDTDKDKIKYASVNSYDDDRMKDCNGIDEKSMYSGIYVNGADVLITSSKLIVPGSIAAMNAANVTITSPGTGSATTTAADVWADSIVLGGYSVKTSAASDDLKGSVINMRAHAYISDDLEVNATGSEFVLTGQYYGYNYASIDNRTYTDEFLKAASGRTFVDNTPNTIKDGATIAGQAHYNSSAIIVNGQNSVLDLSGVSDMYIAGQAYVELSKETKVNEVTVSYTDGTVKDATAEDITVEQSTYEYNSLGEAEDDKGNTVKDDDGNTVYDNYTDTNDWVIWKTNESDLSKNIVLATVPKTVSYDTLSDSGNWKRVRVSYKGVTYEGYMRKGLENKSTIQDYRTGEAISVKSNQLAYIPNWAVHDGADGLYVTLPESVQNLDIFKDNWKVVSKIPVIRSVISGKTYYFFDFSSAVKLADGTDISADDKAAMNKFIASYADLFTVDEITGKSEGATNGLTDITDYDYFKIKMLNVGTTTVQDGKTSVSFADVYSNSAISILQDAKITIRADSKSIRPLLTVAKDINTSIEEKNRFVGEGETGDSTIALPDSVDAEGNPYGYADTAGSLATSVTTKLQSQYKEMKWLLTNRSHNAADVAEAHDMAESDITPINHFFYINKVDKKKVYTTIGGYKVYISDEDLTIKDKDAMGIIICKGDVTFDTDVESFNGLVVAGGKIIINHSMTLAANEQIVKKTLEQCDDSRQYKGSDDISEVCDLFQQFVSSYSETEVKDEIATDSMKSISAVQFEDILGFKNWKKNVD